MATTSATNRFATELRRQFGLYARLMRLDRPIGTWLLLWPTLWALWIAGDGRPDPQIFVVFVLGVIVMRSAGCVINDFADRKLDPHVERTRNRPLATGEVAPAEALVLFLALGLLAIALLLTLNTLTRWLAVAGAALTIIYPFTKRFFVAPQLILGAAFGWGVPMAFAAQTGTVPRLAWLMWLTAVVWAVIYDTLYAMADRAGDEMIGVKSTAILFGSADLFCIGLLQVTMLLALALIGQAAELGAWYFGSIGVAAVLFLQQRIRVNNRDPERCFQAFLANRHVGATIFAGILLDYLYRGG
ncbi:MAG: 4-hydroxybenzoate octaprenyltransferase [Chromatiales bacterium]|nr:MAG: 4-hydroxybenzoate octaprenyltransferase [Chromatiales bacterium]